MTINPFKACRNFFKKILIESWEQQLVNQRLSSLYVLFPLLLKGLWAMTTISISSRFGCYRHFRHKPDEICFQMLSIKAQVVFILSTARCRISRWVFWVNLSANLHKLFHSINSLANFLITSMVLTASLFARIILSVSQSKQVCKNSIVPSKTSNLNSLGSSKNL